VKFVEWLKGAFTKNLPLKAAAVLLAVLCVIVGNL